MTTAIQTIPVRAPQPRSGVHDTRGAASIAAPRAPASGAAGMGAIGVVLSMVVMIGAIVGMRKARELLR